MKDGPATAEARTTPSTDRGRALGGPVARPLPSVWWRALRNELRLTFFRRRNLLLLAGLAALPLVIGIAVKLYGDDGGGDHANLATRITESGLFLAAVAFVVSMPLFLPLVVSVVVGDSLAGEAQLGTVRYAMIVPVSRTAWLALKALAVLVFVCGGVAAIFVVSLATGFGLFGADSMTLLSGDSISAGAGIVRIATMACYVVASMTGLIAVGLFISSLTEVPIAAMAGTAIIPALSTVCLAIPQLAVIHPGLLTRHWMDLTTFLFAQPDGGLLRTGLLVQLAWVAIFGSLAWARVTSANITA